MVIDLQDYHEKLMYMELSTIEKELNKIDEAELGSEERPARSCYDLKLEMPHAESGMYFIDPNLGSPLDSIKTYCSFATSLTYTCVQNDTTTSQLGYLNLLHKTASQKISLPCDADGPFSLQPYRGDAPVTIGGRKSGNVKLTTGPCHMISKMHTVEFTADSEHGQLPFTTPVRHNQQDFHFTDVCFY